MKRAIASLAAILAIGALATTFTLARPAASSVAVGKSAPAFSLADQDGKMVNLSDFSGKVVVLEWFNNECPFVQKHYKEGSMNALAKKYQDKGVVWLAINSTNGKTNEANKSIAADWKIDRPILNDSKGEVGHEYSARTTPQMYVINKDGALVYMGAIDSKSTPDTADIKTSDNYVAKALDEVLDGKPVSVAETKSYGCSVKYAK